MSDNNNYFTDFYEKIYTKEEIKIIMILLDEDISKDGKLEEILKNLEAK